MTSGPGKLVQMVNQIARFFDAQQGDAAAETAKHLHSYWAPSMRRSLVELLHGGGTGLGPTARKAAESIARELEGRPSDNRP
jgi:formate dehydrogenase subunit delta